jgi:hypothetical protein
VVGTDQYGFVDENRLSMYGRNPETGGLFVWPEKIRREKEKTALVMETLAEEVKKAPVRKLFKGYFRTVYDRWRAFHESADIPLYSVIDRAIAFRRDAFAWREALERELSAQGKPAPKSPRPERPPSSPEVWGRRALAAAGILGGAWALVGLWKMIFRKPGEVD